MHIPFSIRLKFWFLQHYWWVLSIVITAAFITLLGTRQELGVIVSTVGSLLSIFYFVQKQKLEELHLFRDIFKEFNARYDEMNENLAKIAANTNPEVTPDERAILVDYFNLCGEEFFYFSRGYIDPSVWNAWYKGMKALLAAQRILKVWNEESATESYYGLSL